MFPHAPVRSLFRRAVNEQMMELWSPDMIRFMRDASEYGTYHSELVKIMEPYISEDMHVCDAGCGIGYLSLELAKKVRRVTAADRNADALKVLEENCRLRGVRNIDIVCGDVFDIAPKEKYSAMVFCYFGRLGDILTAAKRQCAGRVIIFMRNCNEHSFSLSSEAKSGGGFADACRELTGAGIPIEARELEFEFGQPFRNAEDAGRFFEIYSHGENRETITDSFLDGKLTRTGREDFPFYYPGRKKTGCIILNARDIG